MPNRSLTSCNFGAFLYSNFCHYTVQDLPHFCWNYILTNDRRKILFKHLIYWFRSRRHTNLAAAAAQIPCPSLTWKRPTYQIFIITMWRSKVIKLNKKRAIHAAGVRTQQFCTWAKEKNCMIIYRLGTWKMWNRSVLWTTKTIWMQTCPSRSLENPLQLSLFWNI